jgi:hypothetical protein
MESLVDLVTTSFQAVAAVAVVFTAGYAINTRQDAKFASVSNNPLRPRASLTIQSILSVARDVLLPALLFTTLASTAMTWRTLLMREFGPYTLTITG